MGLDLREERLERALCLVILIVLLSSLLLFPAILTASISHLTALFFSPKSFILFMYMCCDILSYEFENRVLF